MLVHDNKSLLKKTIREIQQYPRGNSDSEHGSGILGLDSRPLHSFGDLNRQSTLCPLSFKGSKKGASSLQDHTTPSAFNPQQQEEYLAVDQVFPRSAGEHLYRLSFAVSGQDRLEDQAPFVEQATEEALTKSIALPTHKVLSFAHLLLWVPGLKSLNQDTLGGKHWGSRKNIFLILPSFLFPSVSGK